MRNYIAAVAVAGAVSLSGCAASESPGASSTSAAAEAASPSAMSDPVASHSPASDDAPADPEAAGITITSGGSAFGQMLFDTNDQAIYIFELETSSEPNCYDDCARAWPPVLTEANAVAAGGVAQDKLGTTERSDGSVQVTYNGHPLYYYADEDPGEVKCHNVATHGGLWWVIKPNGNRAA